MSANPPLPLVLVDDEEGIRVVLSILLQDMGYAVTTAASGGEALALVLELRPAIVVTDIKMPGMDGIALLKEIKARSPNTEVLMLTGHGDMDLAVTSLRFGAGDFLSKPVSDAALEVALERARQRISLREALRRHTEELEHLVRERTAELIRTERFAAVGETAAGLAHAIKNIAGALEGTMYVLEKGLALNKREYFEEGWQMIRSDLSRLRALAMNMLDLGRPATLQFHPVDPEQPAREVADLARARANEAGAALELLCEAGPEPFIMAEEGVHQCLLNLVLNAIESFTTQIGGNGAAPAPQVKLCVLRNRLPDGSETVSYVVSDNGPGLKEDMAPEIAGYFRSSKATGSGIGLFATRKIAHEMGAELRFTSSPERGTEVLLRLTSPKITGIS